jgi:hypothetical protein
MKKSRLFGLFCACTFILIATASQATLVGVLPATPGGTDYQAYYDTDADLTWLADANAGLGSEYDAFIICCGSPTGRMTYENANVWVESLNINGVTGWRLPYTPNPDPTCEYIEGPAFYNCSGSEMGNLFYNVLGSVARQSVATTHKDNYEQFSNIQPDLAYWSTLTNSNEAWVFAFGDGEVASLCISCAEGYRQGYVWAVHSGNPGAVPLPAAIYMFGSGILGLFGIARREKAAK